MLPLTTSILAQIFGNVWGEMETPYLTGEDEQAKKIQSFINEFHEHAKGIFFLFYIHY